MNVELLPPLDQVITLCEQGRLAAAEAICRGVLQQGLITRKRHRTCCCLVALQDTAEPATPRASLAKAVLQRGRADPLSMQSCGSSQPGWTFPGGAGNAAAYGCAASRRGRGSQQHRQCPGASGLPRRGAGQLWPGDCTASRLRRGVLQSLGIAQQSLKRYDDAVASYQQAIALLPDYLEAQQSGHRARRTRPLR